VNCHSEPISIHEKHFSSVVTPPISLIEFRLAKAFTQPDNLAR